MHLSKLELLYKLLKFKIKNMLLNEKTKKDLKNKLVAEKGRLESELASFAQPTNRPGDYATKFENIGNDPGENASEVESYTDNLALENTLEKKLREVHAALERMESDSYGVCTKCGRKIDIERLKAYPAASSCLKCE